MLSKCAVPLLACILVMPGCGRVAGRAVAGKAAQRSAARPVGRLLLRDATRDAATAARPLSRPRIFHRYVPAGGLRRELRTGIPAGRHMAPVRQGAPMSSRAARIRYGLPKAPRYRETLRLDKGTPVKHNRALGGSPGFGEALSTQRLPPQAILRHVKLK